MFVAFTFAIEGVSQKITNFQIPLTPAEPYAKILNVERNRDKL